VPVDLKLIPLFRGVNDEALRALGSRTVAKTLPENTLVFKEGDSPDALYVVTSGRVKIYLKEPDGREVTLSTRGPGDYFGEMMLDDQPRSASVMTLERSEFAVVSRPDFTAFVRQHPESALQLIRDLIRLGRGMNARTRENFRQHIAELEKAKVDEIAIVRGWRVAQYFTLATVVLLALYFFVSY
jgi:CRP/FNR family cyclic AMP-dependent transcriptional regulator